MQKTIREVFESKGFDGVWHWAKAGGGKRERYRRFKALQRWAQGHRDSSHGDEREKWNNRRKAYRSQKRKIWRRIHDAPEVITGLGTGPWGGSQGIVEHCVIKTYVKHGVGVTSTKRWETFGNPSSDHYMGNTTAYAADGAVANAQWMHAEIADAFAEAGIPLSPHPSDYAMTYCTASGTRFRYQGIAATHGTGPHHHGGVRRS